MLPTLTDQLEAELHVLENQGRRRTLPGISGSSRVEVRLRGCPLISFCSNDYLGLASHPALAQAAATAAHTSGFGSGASRLVSGDLLEHVALESALASLVGLPSALLFPTGYQANLAAITALAGPSDLIVADRAIHASLIDACRLSRAKLAFYPHLQLQKAEHHLVRIGAKARRRFLVTESLFSMDGDVPQLAEFSALAKAHDAVFVVDEAHAIGVLGPRGSGLCAAKGVVPDVLVGTLGKALGSSGAFIAGTALLREYLLNRARSFVFTTALPPPVAAAALAAVHLVRSAEGESLRSKLADNLANFRSQLRLPADSCRSPIVPLMLGSDDAAATASSRLRALGLFVQPIRPPTVREGTSRLRLTFSANHSPAHIAKLAQALDSLSLPTPTTDHHLSPAICSPPHPHHSSASSPRTSPVRGLFLAGTDTGVGKTSVGIGLLRLMAERGLRPVPFKPVETGAASGPQDATALRSAAQRDDLPIGIVCPIALQQPIAPAAAAATEGVDTSLQVLSDHFTAAASQGSVVLVESAGGLLAPYAPCLTGADLAAAFGLPVLLVARNALGTVNHTALAVAEIRRRGLPLVGIILVNVSNISSQDQPSNCFLIESSTGMRPLGVLPHVPTPTPDSLARQLETSTDLTPIWSAVCS